jgi:hypothetical protein
MAFSEMRGGEHQRYGKRHLIASAIDRTESGGLGTRCEQARVSYKNHSLQALGHREFWISSCDKIILATSRAFKRV